VVLKDVFAQAAERSAKSSPRPFIALSEYLQLFKVLELCEGDFLERDVLLSFNQSMMTQVDEVNSERAFQMTFPEFVESLARASQKCALSAVCEFEVAICIRRPSTSRRGVPSCT